MKYLYTSLAILLSFQLATSQITIIEATLPKVGDVFEYQNFVDYPNTTDYSQSGENISWQFEGFDIVRNSTENYDDISNSPLADSFPDANMLLNFGGFEAAGLRTATTLELVGINVGAFGGFEINASATLSQPFVLATRPLNYGDETNEFLDIAVSFATADIPGLDSLELPIPGATLDSVRVITTIDRTEEVIGWGSATVFSETSEVLQIKQTDITNTSIEIGVTAFGFPVWLPADDLLAGLGGGGFGMGFGEDQEMTTYLFLSNDLKTSVAEFTENEVLDTLGNVIAVNVNGRISGDIISHTREESFISGGYYLYPNPSTDHIRIANRNNTRERLQVELYNVHGQKLNQLSDYEISSEISISQYDEGQYYIVVKEKDKLYSQGFAITR